MAYVGLDRFMFRAPLLSTRTLVDRRANRPTRLFDHPLGGIALTLASPELAASVGLGRSGGSSSSSGSGSGSAVGGDKMTARAALAIDRYRRRASFRPTPHGLWAGVGVGVLGTRTAIDTGQPNPIFRVGHGRLARMARSLLTDPDVRPHACLRQAPSIIVGPRTVIWVGPDRATDNRDPALVEKRADRDDVLGAVLGATSNWTSWAVVRAALAVAADASEIDDSEELDDVLLTMLDDGLLHVDLVPPLVGPPAEIWIRDRLSRIDVPSVVAVSARLEEARHAAETHAWPALRKAVQDLPADEVNTTGIEATLLFRPTATVTLPRAAVARAAHLAPLLFRLQQSLMPPAAERDPDRTFADALDATTEIFGAGALDPSALLLGEYGVSVSVGADEDPPPAATQSPPSALLTRLVDSIVAAARQKAPAVTFQSTDLEGLLPVVDLPATCELFLTPCGARPGKPPGDGWLVGLHAPAGASWGRFTHAIGDDDSARLLEPLRVAELRARPGEQRLDVVFAPGDAVADLCAHAPLRGAALAVTSWPAGEDSVVLKVGDLRICADPAALEPLALRTLQGLPVAPTPLHRVRSTMAPPGIWRLLAGWNLFRQHAPWAFILGPLDDLDWTPRIVIDGFVVAPASWRVPPGFATRAASARELNRWRSRAGLPQFVQVGAEDELLPVDLAAPHAGQDLAGHHRVFEIWPPLGDTPDTAGRRVEAVIALVDEPDPEERARIAAAVAGTIAAGTVSPPRRASHRTDVGARWQTYKIFGMADHQDALLVDAIAPAIRQARDARLIEGWFFLRYVDGPGARPHLRLRVRTARRGDSRFTRVRDQFLRPARAAGDVVTVETVPYFPEIARFGGVHTLEVAHKIFEADSDLACTLLAIEAEGHDAHASGDDASALSDALNSHDWRVLCLVSTFDALADALGLDEDGRRDLAGRRRDAHTAEEDPEIERAHGRAFRIAGPHLRQFLGGAAPPPVATALATYRDQITRAAKSLDTDARQQILSPLLHLSAVRLAGTDRAAEMRAYSFWSRTLESLSRHRKT